MSESPSSVRATIQSQLPSKLNLYCNDDRGTDHVTVTLRCRPPIEKQVQGADSLKLFPKSGTVIVRTSAGKEKTYLFSSVLGPSVKQEEACDKIAFPIVQCVLDGFNGAIIAYGQTGSGKTYTMQGYSLQESMDHQGRRTTGLVQYVCETFFANIRKQADFNPKIKFKIEASYLEIYNEMLVDLLKSESREGIVGDVKRPVIRESENGEVQVVGITKEIVKDPRDCYRLLLVGEENRVVTSTKMNSKSSRSHTVFTLSVEKQDLAKGTKRVSKIQLVDLAGSERQKSTGATGARLREASGINKSLSALGNIVNHLANSQRPSSIKSATRTPSCRDSKLTFVLKECFGGNSKLCLVATISPTLSSLNETITTLEFAQRCTVLKNSAVINESRLESVDDLKLEIRRLNNLLNERNGMNLDVSNDDGTNHQKHDVHAKTLRSLITAHVNDGNREELINRFIFLLCDIITPGTAHVHNDNIIMRRGDADFNIPPSRGTQNVYHLDELKHFLNSLFPPPTTGGVRHNMSQNEDIDDIPKNKISEIQDEFVSYKINKQYPENFEGNKINDLIRMLSNEYMQRRSTERLQMLQRMSSNVQVLKQCFDNIQALRNEKTR